MAVVEINGNSSDKRVGAGGESINLTNTLKSKFQFVGTKKSESNGIETEEVERELVFDKGWYGWLVVLSSFFLHFIILGVQYSYSVYINHYIIHFGDRSNKAFLSLVGTIATALQSAVGLFSGKLADVFGYRLMIMIGITILSLGLLLASFSVEPWHLLITQGVMVGLGASIVFYPAISIPSHYFKVNRGLATGICSAGSGLGGLIFSPLIQSLIETLSIQWAVRITAIIGFVVGMLASIAIKERVKPKKAKFIDLNLLKTVNFYILWSGAAMFSFGYLVPHYLLPIYAKEYGIDNSKIAIMVGLISGGSAFGRILMGSLADRFGRMNIFFIGLFLASLFVLLLWMFSTTFVPLLIFAIFYGMLSGTFYALLPTLSSFLFGTENIATTNGWLFFANFIPNLVGAPIASSILAANETVVGDVKVQNFTPVIVFAGVTILIGSFFILVLKFNVNRNLFVKN